MRLKKKLSCFRRLTVIGSKQTEPAVTYVKFVCLFAKVIWVHEKVELKS